MATRPDWLVPGYPALEGDVGSAAVNGQLVHYPQVVRQQQDPPILNQTMGLVSFMLFKEPQMLKGKPVYGYVKIRGNHASEDAAMNGAHDIIKKVDSKFRVLLAPVGHWLPITESDSVVKESVDVRTADEEKHLRDLAMREKRAENERIQREIREREDELKNGGDIYDDPTSLKYYAMKRVTEGKLREEIHRIQLRLDSIQSKHREVALELRRLEVTKPTYNEEWVECYNIERRKAGILDYVPNEKEVEAYNAMTFTEEELAQ